MRHTHTEQDSEAVQRRFPVLDVNQRAVLPGSSVSIYATATRAKQLLLRDIQLATVHSGEKLQFNLHSAGPIGFNRGPLRSTCDSAPGDATPL